MTLYAIAGYDKTSASLHVSITRHRLPFATLVVRRIADDLSRFDLFPVDTTQSPMSGHMALPIQVEARAAQGLQKTRAAIGQYTEHVFGERATWPAHGTRDAEWLQSVLEEVLG